MYKLYELQRNISRSVRRFGSKFITFDAIGFNSNYSSGKPRFSTTDVSIQKGIEDSKDFEKGIIRLVKTENETQKDNKLGVFGKAVDSEQEKYDAALVAKNNEDLLEELEAKAKEKEVLEARLAELEAKMNAGNSGGGPVDGGAEAKAKTEEEARIKAEAEAKEALEAGANGGNSPKLYPDVLNIQDAREILRKDYGVSAQASGTKAAIENRMRDHNISFPNIVW